MPPAVPCKRSIHLKAQDRKKCDNTCLLNTSIKIVSKLTDVLVWMKPIIIAWIAANNDMAVRTRLSIFLHACPASWYS